MIIGFSFAGDVSEQVLNFPCSMKPFRAGPGLSIRIFGTFGILPSSFAKLSIRRSRARERFTVPFDFPSSRSLAAIFRDVSVVMLLTGGPGFSFVKPKNVSTSFRPQIVLAVRVGFQALLPRST